MLSLKHFKLFLFSCFLFASCTKIQNQQIIFRLGETVWKLKEVQEYFLFRLKNSSFEKTSFQEKELKQKLLNELILRALVETWAKNSKIQIKKIHLDKKERRAYRKSPRKLKLLKDHKNYLSLYRILLKELYKKIPSPKWKEQQAFYKKNQALFRKPASCYLKQILVKTKKMARSLKQRLDQGESFDKLSKLYSIKPHPGWVKKGDLPIFDKACFHYKKALSPVLKSPYGYHLFSVKKIQASEQKSFKEVKKQIIYLFKKAKAKKQFQIWLKEESSRSTLFINKNLLDKIHIQYKNNKI